MNTEVIDEVEACGTADEVELYTEIINLNASQH